MRVSLRLAAMLASLVLWAVAGCAEGDEGVSPGSCSDGQDNDGDELVDCADPGCCGGIECAICSDDGSSDDDSDDDDSAADDDDDSAADDDDDDDDSGR